MKDEETIPQSDETPEAAEIEVTPEEDGAELDFASMETPEELAPTAHAPQRDGEPVAELPPPLDRPRSHRRPLVSRAIWITLGVFAAVVVLGAAAWTLNSRSIQVTVPTVTGRPEGVARTILAQTGLETRVSERRFSDSPEGQVLAQSPTPGSQVSEGEVVELVVSAGTEELLMPDVVGDGIALARGTLEAAGLVVTIESVPSQAASETVLSSTPAPGVPVRSGDTVRLQVATPIAGGTVLQPYKMDGLVFVIDPAPVESGQTDITLTSARRLQALLEASGAKVRLLRSSTSTATAESARRKAAAKVKTATAGIGLSVRNAGLSGRTVAGSNRGASPAITETALVGGMTNQLAIRVPPATQVTASGDPVFGTKWPWVRIGLGSFDNAADEAAFEDPRWADRVAEAIYTGLGEVFGSKEQL